MSDLHFQLGRKPVNQLATESDRKQETEDGKPVTYTVNHLLHQLLTESLNPLSNQQTLMSMSSFWSFNFSLYSLFNKFLMHLFTG